MTITLHTKGFYPCIPKNNQAIALVLPGFLVKENIPGIGAFDFTSQKARSGNLLRLIRRDNPLTGTRRRVLILPERLNGFQKSSTRKLSPFKISTDRSVTKQTTNEAGSGILPVRDEEAPSSRVGPSFLVENFIRQLMISRRIALSWLYDAGDDA